MDDHEHRSKKYVPPGASKNTKNIQHNKIVSGLVGRARTVNALQLVAGFTQVFLGLAVVTISVMGLIKPFWLSTVLSIIASVTTMTGIYYCYAALSAFNKDSLLRNAMRRIVEDQN